MSADDENDITARFDAERALLEMARSTGLLDPGGHEDPLLLARAKQIIGGLPDDHLHSFLQRLAGIALSTNSTKAEFCRRYSISSAEQSLLESFISGSSVTEHAKAKGISVNTARTHMRRLIEKTGTKNQVDLIRLYFSQIAD